MTESERQAARAELIRDLSLKQFTADLEGKSYGELVDKYVRDFGSQLPAIIAGCEKLVTPEESDGVMNILQDVESHALEPDYWLVDAEVVLRAISCGLNDAMFPTPADDAGVFNLFQLATARLAERARIDEGFHRMVLSPLTARPAHSESSGLITKMLGIAISDCDAGRISKKQLLEIFQDAIDNGDILEPDNELDVVGTVFPLVDDGVLQPSQHLKTFEDRMNKKLLAELSQARRAESRSTRRTRSTQSQRQQSARVTPHPQEYQGDDVMRTPQVDDDDTRFPDLGAAEYDKQLLQELDDFGSSESNQRFEIRKQEEEKHLSYTIAKALKQNGVNELLKRRGLSEQDLRAFYERIEIINLPPNLRELALCNEKILEYFFENSEETYFSGRYVRNVKDLGVHTQLTLWAAHNPGGDMP